MFRSADKYLGRPEHQKHVAGLGLYAEDGRATSASKIADAVVASCLSRFYDPSLDDADVDAELFTFQDEPSENKSKELDR